MPINKETVKTTTKAVVRSALSSNFTFTGSHAFGGELIDAIIDGVVDGIMNELTINALVIGADSGGDSHTLLIT